MKRRRVKTVACLTVIVGCLFYLVVSGFRQASVFYMTVTELQARESEFAGKRIKLAGKVTPGSIRKDPQTMAVAFKIWEPLDGAPGTFSEQRAVYYRGIVPDTFREEADVVLEGRQEADGVFHAETLLAKCPSKYEGQSYEELKRTYGNRTQQERR